MVPAEEKITISEGTLKLLREAMLYYEEAQGHFPEAFFDRFDVFLESLEKNEGIGFEIFT